MREEHLVRLIKESIQSFQDTWDGRLNFPSPASIPAEHWTRIKALTRRISEFREDRYDNLDPVAEAIDKFQNSICKFLLKNKIDKKITNKILKLCHGENRILCRFNLISQELIKWESAYNFRGTGSVKMRADMIQSIYKQKMPVSDSNEVLRKIIEIVITNYSEN